MRIFTLVGITLLVAPLGTLSAAESPNLENETARINYSLGYQIGGDFKRQGVQLDPQAVVKGIEDALSGADPMMPPQQMRATLAELKRKIVTDQRAKKAENELQLLAEGKKYLEENAGKPGVMTTQSGLQYQIIEQGTGKVPAVTDKVTVQYRGTLVNGNEFDSSYARGKPATFQLDRVIKGWTEGLQLVGEGGKIKLFIPSALAYGDRGPLAHRTLIFDVELISVGESAQATQ